jgi:hypothetical protein
MPMVTLHKVGEGNLYHLHVLDPTDPGFGGGRPGGGDPGYGRPEGGRPGHDLPGSGARPDHGLPGAPGDTLPVQPPPTLAPGWTLVMVRSGTGKWEYAAIAPGSPPPRPLPPSPGHPGNVPPGTEVPGGGPVIPPQYPTGQPVPPTPTPTR